MVLWLAAKIKGEVKEATILAWSERCVSRIVPRRDPDRMSSDWRAWIVPVDRRRAFGFHTSKMLEQFKGCQEEELYGFFALVGFGKRWADLNTVEWQLILAKDYISDVQKGCGYGHIFAG